MNNWWKSAASNLKDSENRQQLNSPQRLMKLPTATLIWHNKTDKSLAVKRIKPFSSAILEIDPSLRSLDASSLLAS